ncbi:MAG: hypothetical protein KGQ37_03720 [Hyphomicrobiales bacterium]|nr:hypothetical protein [Hyphomicrobiales bacterium]
MTHSARLPATAEGAAICTSIGSGADLPGYEHADWPWLINGRADSRGYWFTAMPEFGVSGFECVFSA